MAQQPNPTVENHFIAGLKTEYTGLNFPENAATDTQNCVYTLIGDVNRRGGINYEANFQLNNINVANVARSSFRWLNSGGDGTSQILVQQIGNLIYFYKSSSATTAKPLSTTLLSSVIDITLFKATGNTTNVSQSECQYAIGNGYLFVFHPGCDPFYCTFSNSLVTANKITLQIRDQIGIVEPGVPDTFRPSQLTSEHTYNLLNQGWTQGSAWTGVSSYFGTLPLSNAGPTLTTLTFTLSSQSLVAPSNGDTVQVVINPTAGTGDDHNQNGVSTLLGVVSNYVAGPPSTITINFFSNDHHNLDFTGIWSGGNFFAVTAGVNLTKVNTGFIGTWHTDIGNYPSNSDVWWLYKNTTLVFTPAGTIGNVQSPASPAPKGTFLLNVFNQDRSTASSIAGLTPVSTTVRPSTGTFFQSRVWYAGVNAFQGATGDASDYTWTENIYFSQIVESPLNFGRCYQTNDPTSQNLFEELPSDGGVFTIPGSGQIYKLFALRFGLLVFAANGIWFVSGSTGIGFTAVDFTVTKISSIVSISGTSFVDVQGYPMFWNQEGIYTVTPSQQPGSAHSPDIQLSVDNLCLGTILTYYGNIPLISKPFARGDYHQLDYVVQWCFRSTNETGIGDRYSYDSILNFNIVTKAFYPYTLPNSISKINDIKYIQNPGGSGAPGPVLKYITSNSTSVTFSEENDFTLFVDFFNENGKGYNFISYFITGYKVPGKFLTKFQTPYVYVFSRNPSSNSYAIQAIWDYAGSGLSGRFSTKEIRQNSPNNFTNMYHRIRLRGRGLAVQFKVTSIDGKPFDLMGWSVWNMVNTGI